MHIKSLVCAAAMTFAFIPAHAEDAGAPASPSGSPKAAAESGSSNVGKDASKEEMSSHNKETAKQGKMSDPHKQAQ